MAGDICITRFEVGSIVVISFFQKEQILIYRVCLFSG